MSFLYRKFECQFNRIALELGNAWHLGENSRCSRVFCLRLLLGCVLEIARVKATFQEVKSEVKSALVIALLVLLCLFIAVLTCTVRANLACACSQAMEKCVRGV